MSDIRWKVSATVEMSTGQRYSPFVQTIVIKIDHRISLRLWRRGRPRRLKSRQARSILPHRTYLRQCGRPRFWTKKLGARDERTLFFALSNRPILEFVSGQAAVSPTTSLAITKADTVANRKYGEIKRSRLIVTKPYQRVLVSVATALSSALSENETTKKYVQTISYDIL